MVDCLKTSTPPFNLWHDGACLKECPSGYYSFEDKGKCREAKECPKEFYADSILKKCIDKTTCIY